MKNFWNYLFIIAQILAYVLAIIVIIQILKLIFGGSWNVEDVILTLVVLNLTLSFSLFGYIYSTNNRMMNKLNELDKKLHGHLEWHKGKSYL